MKNNLLSIVLAIALVIVSSSIGYYYLKIIPDQHALEMEITRQKIRKELVEDCAERGESKYQAEMKEAKEAGNGEFLLPVYIYNDELDACLYRGIYVGDGGYRGKYIINLYTNENIAESDYYDNKFFSGLTSSEFLKKEGELMK